VRLLTAARAGLIVGFAITMPVAVWLGPQVLGRSPERADVPAAMADALRALWLGQGIAIALAGPRGIGSWWLARALGVGVVIAVALPLLAAAWLAHAASARALARGVGVSFVSGAAVVLLAGAIESARLGPEPRRVALAAVELGLASALWAFRGSWLGWILA
jgi:hypothetical protein